MVGPSHIALVTCGKCYKLEYVIGLDTLIMNVFIDIHVYHV